MSLRAALAEHNPGLLREWEERRHAEGRALSPADGETVARFRSRTDPAMAYKVSLGRGGALMCECPGFEFRRTCAHTRAASLIYGPTRATRRPRVRGAKRAPAAAEATA